jgi:hypothetical protein
MEKSALPFMTGRSPVSSLTLGDLFSLLFRAVAQLPTVLLSPATLPVLSGAYPEVNTLEKGLILID